LSKIISLAFIFLCLTVTPETLARTQSPRLYQPTESGRSIATYQAVAKHGMVATAHPLASKAAIDILKKGGNAFDAAVAASFVISVVRPQSTGIGGGGFLLTWEQKAKKTEVYDFRERAPALATRDMYVNKDGSERGQIFEGKLVPNSSLNGHLSVGVPGLVAGLVEVHAKKGKLKLSEVMEAAIDIAESGFTVYGGLAEDIIDRKDILSAFPSSQKIFLPSGVPLKVGDRLVQKDLAWTLKQIAAKGRDGFYKGEVAERIIAEMKKGSGILSAKDLLDYKVKTRDPIRGSYRGFKIVSMPPPSSGGVHIVQMLNMLENVEFGKFAHGSAESIHILSEVMRRAFADRAEYLGDPEFVKVPIKGLISKDYAKKLYTSIDLKKATPSAVVKPGNPEAYESPSTTHLSVVDSEGNAVSTTQTINYSFGSCVVAEGTGIVLNDEMDDFSKKPGTANVFGLVGNEANAIAAGKTMLSSMSPTLVFDKDDKLILAVGSPGGPRIISATLQTIINVIDHKMPLDQAVHAARIHHQWSPDILRVEAATLSLEVSKSLEVLGHKIDAINTIGDVQAVGTAPQGLIGVSDTRSEGQPMGY
jgi:gamma-glutamyltranspeptidase/glutathione hydrolase